MATMFGWAADKVREDYDNATWDNDTADVYVGLALNDWYAYEMRTCAFHTLDAVSAVIAALRQALGDYSSTTYTYHLYNCLKRSWEYTIKDPPEAEVTMDAILSVMVTATDSQLMNFIGLVDAYRQSLWNKDFNAEYFAALARGFE